MTSGEAYQIVKEINGFIDTIRQAIIDYSLAKVAINLNSSGTIVSSVSDKIDEVIDKLNSASIPLSSASIEVKKYADALAEEERKAKEAEDAANAAARASHRPSETNLETRKTANYGFTLNRNKVIAEEKLNKVR